jgi:predicted nucleic acid-binding protein
MTVVIDASVAIKWVCDETGSDRALSLLTGEPLVAPSLWLVEAANALWRRRKLGELTRSQIEARLEALKDAPVRSIDTERLVEPSLRLADDLGHPVYDCLYLATAIELDTHVVTADRRFEKIVGRRSALKQRLRLL